jgi:small GTP-binding protein
MSEIRIGIIGNVDSGKSTLVSVLTNEGLLDDGRGSARKMVLKHQHEKETGRTSCISHKYLIVNENKYITFVDLAGHEKYLKTTLRGLSGGCIDYVIVVIGANMGVSRMTREHISIATALDIPIIIAITKIDLGRDNILKKTIKDTRKIIKNSRSTVNTIYVVKDTESIKKHFNYYNENYKTYCPIFLISNKSGSNIKRLRNFIKNLDPRYDWLKFKEDKKLFVIDDKFIVNGVGLVLSGKLKSGCVSKNDKLFVGPFNGKWYRILIKSIHNNFRKLVDTLETGESGCFAIRFIDKVDPKTLKFSKGTIVIDNSKYITNKFNANIIVLNSHATTITKTYQPVINCNTITQAAKISYMKSDCIRGGDKTEIGLEFIHKPEYITIGDIFIFREGKTRGIGKVLSLEKI